MSRIIGQNADWLDGRLFQKLAMIAARANYEDDDLDDYGTFDDLRKAFGKAAEIALKVATE
ncbi:hypothetical protein D9M70_647660 [compost metagenome]